MKKQFYQIVEILIYVSVVIALLGLQSRLLLTDYKRGNISATFFYLVIYYSFGVFLMFFLILIYFIRVLPFISQKEKSANKDKKSKKKSKGDKHKNDS